MYRLRPNVPGRCLRWPFCGCGGAGRCASFVFLRGALAAETLHLGTNFLATERSERCIVGDDFAVARHDDLWQRLNRKFFHCVKLFSRVHPLKQAVTSFPQPLELCFCFFNLLCQFLDGRNKGVIVEQFTNLLQRETKISEVANGIETLHLTHAIETIAAPLIHFFRKKQALLLVVAQGLHRHLHQF